MEAYLSVINIIQHIASDTNISHTIVRHFTCFLPNPDESANRTNKIKNEHRTLPTKKIEKKLW